MMCNMMTVKRNFIVGMTLVVILFIGVAPALAQLGVTISPPAPLNNNAGTDTGGDLVPKVATDGKGRWVAVWESHDTLGGTIGTDADILVAHSDNNGQTWSNPAALNSSATTDTGDDFSPALATDGPGNWVVVWHFRDVTGGATGSDYDAFVARSGDHGASWSNQAPLNNNAATDTGADILAQIIFDGQGNWVAVWSCYDSLGGTIGTDADIVVAFSSDLGATWSDPAPLNTNASTDNSTDSVPQFATDFQGHWVTVWTSPVGSDGDLFVASSEDNAATWTDPIPLNTNAISDTGADENPQIATDGAGHWVVVWESLDTLGGTIGGDYDILVSRSDDNGATWTNPAPLNSNAATDSTDDRSSYIDTDRNGHWVVVWRSAIGGDADILVVRSDDHGATWSDPAPLNTNAISDTGNDGSPHLTTNGTGRWVTVWTMAEVGGDLDILAARFILPDCNGNEIEDILDINDGRSEDCDANGVPDECQDDSDSDGFIDVCDNCPNDSNANQRDDDGDGIGNACDECPDDVNKIAPGVCGCGTAEEDADGNGTLDCEESPGGLECCGGGTAMITPLMLLGWSLMRRRTGLSS